MMEGSGASDLGKSGDGNYLELSDLSRSGSVQDQRQPMLHSSLLQNPLEGQREFITGIHSLDVDYENKNSGILSPEPHNAHGIDSSNMKKSRTVASRSPIPVDALHMDGSTNRFKDYLLTKLERTNSQLDKNNDHILESLSSSNLKSVKSHAQLAKTAQGVRILAKNLSKATIKLQLKSVMIVTKARDNSLIYLTRELAGWLLAKYEVNVYVDYHLEYSKRFNAAGLVSDSQNCSDRLRYWTKELVRDDPDEFDLVLTLGGDGTVLYVSTLFQRVVPPVLSFSLGSLGFLTNFKFEDFRPILDQVLRRGVKTNLRMRFTCRVHKLKGDLVCEQQVLNEIVIDRGPSPWVSMLELYGDGSLLTVAQADGLILATPTGSTAYSLSAGGSLVHPGVSAISVTPICAHTLSFRPILLPDSMTLTVKVPLRSRSNAWCSFDGRSRIELQKGDYVTVVASPFPFPTVKSSKTEFVDSVSRILNWNAREEQKSFVHLLSDKNKQLFAKHKESQSKVYHDLRGPTFDMGFGEENDSTEHEETDSINSLDYHQAYFEDDENYNGEEHNQEEANFDIDYSDDDGQGESPSSQIPSSGKSTANLTASKMSKVGGSSSTIEIDDTKDYIPGTLYKPAPEDEIHTPKLEKDLSLLEQVNLNKSLEASQEITESLINKLQALSSEEN